MNISKIITTAIGIVAPVAITKAIGVNKNVRKKRIYQDSLDVFTDDVMDYLVLRSESLIKNGFSQEKMEEVISEELKKILTEINSSLEDKIRKNTE